MRTAMTFMAYSAALSLLWLAAGCSQTMPDRAERMTRGYVYYLDGAGGGSLLSNWSGGVRDGLLAAGYDGAGEMFAWNTGGGVVADQNASVDYKRSKANELAREIQQYAQEHRGAPLTLIGLSAGTAVAVFTLEALPPTCPVDHVILLGASVSADHDLTRALHRVRNRMHVFTSEKDAVLAFMVPMAGTADRTSSPSAGLRGFVLPAGASSETRAQYAKVAHVAWRPEFAKAGDFGGHTDTVKAPFVRQYIAPLIMVGDTHETPKDVAVADGKVRNPDYDRWANGPRDSTVTFEGFQEVNGVKQPLRVTARLISKHPDRLVIERTYVSSDAAQPVRVQRFIMEAKIDPEEHPLTHPQAIIKELPGERVTIGGKSFGCRVRTIDCPASFAEWGRDIRCTLHTTDEIHGGIARISLQAFNTSNNLEMHSHLDAIVANQSVR